MYLLAVGPKKEKASIWGEGWQCHLCSHFDLKCSHLAELLLILLVCIFELLCAVNCISLQTVGCYFFSALYL